jgi:hypothetical protein
MIFLKKHQHLNSIVCEFEAGRNVPALMAPSFTLQLFKRDFRVRPIQKHVASDFTFDYVVHFDLDSKQGGSCLTEGTIRRCYASMTLLRERLIRNSLVVVCFFFFYASGAYTYPNPPKVCATPASVL